MRLTKSQQYLRDEAVRSLKWAMVQLENFDNGPCWTKEAKTLRHEVVAALLCFERALEKSQLRSHELMGLALAKGGDNWPDGMELPRHAYFDRLVELNRFGRDKNGKYWGLPRNLRVRMTKDGKHYQFYRQDQ